MMIEVTEILPTLKCRNIALRRKGVRPGYEDLEADEMIEDDFKGQYISVNPVLLAVLRLGGPPGVARRFKELHGFEANVKTIDGWTSPNRLTRPTNEVIRRLGAMAHISPACIFDHYRVLARYRRNLLNYWKVHHTERTAWKRSVSPLVEMRQRT